VVSRREMALAWVFSVAFMVAAGIGIFGYYTQRDELFIPALGVAFAGAGVAGVQQNIKFWRGESPWAHQVHPPTWWPFSDGLWRGNVRSTPLMAVGGVLMLTSAALLMAVRDLGWPAPADRVAWYGVLRFVVVVLWVVTPSLGISVILFNRPRFVVPPHLRDQRGMVTDRV
jgi:hypothetical protein